MIDCDLIVSIMAGGTLLINVAGTSPATKVDSIANYCELLCEYCQAEDGQLKTV